MSAAVSAADQARTGAAIVPFPDSVPVMLSIKEVAGKYRLPVHMVRQAVASGVVYAIQSGSKKYYVNEQSVIRWLTGGADRGNT